MWCRMKEIFLFRVVFKGKPEFAFNNETLRGNAVNTLHDALESVGLEYNKDYEVEFSKCEIKPKSKAKLKLKRGGK